MSWIPDPLKQQIVDAVVEFLGKQSEDLVGQQLGDKIRGLSSQGALRKALSDAFERGIERFQHEYADIDEDLAADVVAVPDFWDDRTVQKAILTLVSNPGIARPEEQAAVVAHFESVLPKRRNRQRVDQAISYLLRLVAEEVWAVPGAGDIRQLYALQMQRISTEALQQQVSLLRANLQANTQLSADIRQVLLQITDAAERRLLSAPPPPSLPQRARPYHNLPNRSYSRFVGRKEELKQLLQLMLPYPRSRYHVVTLDGIGGVGKSALALECAYRYRDSYAQLAPDEQFDAIIWISAKRTLLTAKGIQQRKQTFNALNDLYREIATVLEEPTILQSDIDQRHGLVARALTRQRTLLIVDNLETIDDEELLTFLRELPDPTKAIITTRHRIDIAYPIRLSGMIEEDAQLLMAIEAGRKKVDLPLEHMSDFFRRTGGIPLAIVWSIGLMSVGHGVEAVLRKLGSGHSDIAQFCFKESVAIIQGRDAEHLLMAMALFEAGVSRDLLGTVAGLKEDEIGRDDGLAELEQLSLINKEGDLFYLLPLTRVFALEELTRQPVLDQSLREQWIRTLVVVARPYRLPDWRLRDLDGLKRDGQHLLAVANWTRQMRRVEDYLAVVPALMAYFDCIGDWKELILIGRDGLDYAQLTTDPVDQLRLENILAWILSQQGNHSEAEKRVAQAMRIAEQIASPEWQIDVLQTYSQVRRRQLLFEDAEEICNRANNLISQIPEEHQPYIRANIEYELGKIARDREAWEDAELHFLEARTVYNEDVEDPVFNLEWVWGLLSNLGLVAHKRGRLDLALERYEKALGFFQQGGSIGNIATLLVRLADLQLDRGDRLAARRYAEDGLELSKRLGLEQEQNQLRAIFERLKG